MPAEPLHLGVTEEEDSFSLEVHRSSVAKREAPRPGSRRASLEVTVPTEKEGRPLVNLPLFRWMATQPLVMILVALFQCSWSRPAFL